MFTFKSFTIHQDRCAMKVGTDGVLLGAWAQGGSRILDIGTGTGIIAMMMAQRFPDADITAIDIDAEACKQAAENVRESVFKGRIIVKEEALQSYCRNHLEQQHPLYDSIVSNPPFFVNSLRNPDARRTTARHTDSLSFAELFRSVSRLLSDDGMFSAIIPTDNEKVPDKDHTGETTETQLDCICQTSPATDHYNLREHAYCNGREKRMV